MDRQRDITEEAEPTSTEVVTQILNDIVDSIPGRLFDILSLTVFILVATNVAFEKLNSF